MIRPDTCYRQPEAVGSRPGGFGAMAALLSVGFYQF